MHEGRRPVQAQAYASYDSIMNRMDVDAVQANKVASAYITRVLNCGNPTMLPTAPNKNDVGGIVAMGVHLLNKTNWGSKSATCPIAALDSSCLRLQLP